MSNGHGGGPPNPPESLKVTCLFKGEDVAIFKGGEIEPDPSPARLVLNGSTEYFTAGASYTVTFDPLPADNVPAGG